MRTLIRIFTAAGIALGCTVGGCAVGIGIGRVITGDNWDNVHQGFMLVALLALVLGFFGLIAGVFLADRHDRRAYPGTCSNGSPPQ